MGIRGLSSFIHANSSILFQDYKLHDCKVIIDGPNLLGHLFQGSDLAFDLGGDYDRFAVIVKRFFETLTSCNVTPYVLFDGGMDPDLRKLDTIKKRRENRIRNVKNQIFSTGKYKESVIPILTSQVFKDVIKTLNIPHACCYFEVDREIAVLAYRWKCPVMTNDSDFFIYDLEGGVIPLKILDMEPVDGDNFKYIPVKMYQSSNFTQKYPKPIRSAVLPAFASILGNDHLDESLFRRFYEHAKFVLREDNFKFKIDKCSRRFRASLYWLDHIPASKKEMFSSVLSFLPKTKREGIKRDIDLSFEEYVDLKEFNGLDLEKFFSNFEPTKHVIGHDKFAYPELKDMNGKVVPNWFMGAIRRCEISSRVQSVHVVGNLVLNCQIEKMEDVTSYECSRHIREACYGVLFPERNAEITEYDRVREKVVEYKRVPRVFPFSWSIHQSPDEDNREDRRLILFAALEFLDFVQEQRQPRKILTNTTKLFIAMLCSWVKNANPKLSQNAVKSLIITTLFQNVKYLIDGNALKEGLIDSCGKTFDAVHKALKESTEEEIKHFMEAMSRILGKRQIRPGRFKAVYMFSQFQAVLDDSTLLNDALARPIRLMGPTLIYSGTTACKLFDELEAQKSFGTFLDNLLGSDSPLQRLFRSINDFVEDECGSAWL